MTENNKFWRNQVKVFHCQDLDELQKQLNQFYKDRFVIATQIFPLLREGYNWACIVYFKIKPEP